MGYLNIVETLKTAANRVNIAGTFCHGKRLDTSFVYDEPMPQIHLLPFTTTVDIPNDQDNSLIQMFFCFQDSPSSTPEERQVIIGEADKLADAFIAALTDMAIPITNVRKEPNYQSLSAVASGYLLFFNIITYRNPC